VKENFGKLDILVHSTGGPKSGRFIELEWEDWVEATRLLSLSAVWVGRRAAELMIPQHWGKIIYIASVTIKEPWDNLALSNIMRLPIAGIIRTLARELKPYGITFKGVLPSIVLTNHVKQLTEDRVRRECKTPEQVLNEWTRDIPLKD